MQLTVELSDGKLLSELVDALKRSGCRAQKTSHSACHVVHPLASDENEALLEVAFFIRSWQLRYPGVGATLRA
jgi:hypothetical protein